MKGGVQTKRKPLTPAQIQALTSIPEWSWGRRKDSWQNHFDAAVEYKAQFGQLPSAADRTQGVRYKGLLLASWLGKEKSRIHDRSEQQRDLVKNFLPELLEQEFAPRGSFSDNWGSNYEALLEWWRQNNSSHVPQSTIFMDLHLGRWVTKQRQRYKLKKIPKYQIDLLTQFKDWTWNASDRSASALSMTGVSPAKRKRQPAG